MFSAVTPQTVASQAAFVLGSYSFQASAEAGIARIFDGASYESLLFPLVVATVSFATLLSRLVATLFQGRQATLESTQENPREPGLRAATRYYIDSRGGNLPFFYRALQFLNTAALLSITLFCYVSESNDVTHKAPPTATFYIIATYVYAFFLTLFSLLATKQWSTVVNRHASTIFFLSFGVFAYRDLYPFATFNSHPKDLHEGRILWYKIALLFVNGIMIPGLLPRDYIPYNPKKPSSEINPEQTASIFSLITYSYMDPTVFLAYRLPHLSHDQLPPLADYDHAHNLKSSSFKHLDFFSGAKKQHIFWNIMKVFRLQYILMALMVVFWVIASFISPVAINRLLTYLETGGHDATHKPWAWILCLFLGPLTVSFFFQGYIFFAMRAMVQFEAIATQLIFEHALRIRIKAETESKEEKTSAVLAEASNASNTSESVLEPEEDCQHFQEVTVVTASNESTVQPSSSSVTTVSSKDLKKRKKVEGPPITKANNLIGRINNLVTTDMGIVMGARDLMLVIVYAPFQITLCILFLYNILGWSAYVGLATMIILFPIPGVIAQKINQVQKLRLQRTDARVQTVTETMNMLRMVKMFGWEKKMGERLSEKREEELVWLWKRQILDLITGNVNYIIPLVVMISTYTTYVRPPIATTVIMKQELRASIVFSSMTVFDLLREQLFMAFYMFNNIVSGKVSLDRIDEFLQTTELLDPFTEEEDEDIFFPQPEVSEEKIGFNNASFTWSAESDGTLTPSKRAFVLTIDGELIFKPNGLNLIVGPTGSGKTSILMALLGEMHYVPLGSASWFNLPRSGGVSYAAQESWVQNETIRENIIFDSTYDEERYRKVLYQCGLERDLELFEAGDQTEVGEKGLTLSGGQKARVTLARAIYSPAKIILLDDVLAALDVHTAKWVVDECFSGDLVKDRTIILVTHNIAMTRGIAEFAVSVGLDGKIIAQGTIEEVLGKDKEIAREFQEDREALAKDDEVIDQPIVPVKKDGKLIVAEEMQEGHIKWKSFKLFLAALGGSHPGLFFLVLIGGLGLVEFLNAFQTWFLGYWASQYDDHPSSEVSVPFYLGSYVGLLSIAVMLYMSVFIVYIYGVIRASRKLHSELLASILGTTLRWLDTTPTSRIITRCTQDIRAVDDPIKDYLKWITELTMSMLIKFAAVVFMTPIFVIPGFIVATLGGWVGQIYMAAQLSVKREMSNAKAPVVGHFGAAIAGLTSIRAYGAQEAFINKSQERINRYSRAGRTFYNLNRWVCIRIDLISGLFSAGLAFYLVYFQNHTAANTGFSLNMAVGFSAMILWWIRNFNEFEVQGNSLERLQNYIDIEQEAPATQAGIPPAYWPASGSLVVKSLSAKYSADGPKVLQDISFELKGGQRLGIVGRTGSGKSSLTLALLRCIFTEGEVYYDGIKTDTLNLDALRSSITIIPQVPELLSGTLRTNLDPFDQYEDAALNDALRAAGLFTLQADMDEGRITLDSNISSGGSNLSVGQRQILALARAIVRGSKLLFLDEATSAIDHKTDTAIQTSLRNELGRDTTVITVAHRLQTVMDADKIMVLDAGRIVEFDSPSNLLKREKGFLRALVDESGDKENLYDMAGGKM